MDAYGVHTSLAPLGSRCRLRAVDGAESRFSGDATIRGRQLLKAPLADNAPVDAASLSYVNDLRRQVRWGTYVNTTAYSLPVLTVPAGQPTDRVVVDRASGAAALGAAFASVPIPATAQPSTGTDGTLVVWQPSADRLWEFWRLYRATDGWHASWGGAMNGVSTNPGYFSNPQTVPWWQDPERYWGASASGLAVLGGVIRIQELSDGVIDHAISMAIPAVRYKYYSWPAQRTDGKVTYSAAPMEGMRFRLPATLDIAALNLPRATAAIARAAQRYGIVLADGSGNAVTISAENPGPSGSDPYPALFGGAAPSAVLKQFPWDQLVTLQTNVDRTPPTTTITNGPPPTTSQSTASFTFASDDPNVKMQCGIDAVRIANCGSNYTFSGLADGAHRAWGQAIDRAGLYLRPVTFDFAVDSTLPPGP